MTLHLMGRLQSVKLEDRKDRAGQPFEVTTFVVEGWGVTYYVDKAKSFEGEIPAEGADVTLEVTPRPFKRANDTVGVGWSARRFVQPKAAGVRAAS